jgi:DNA repair photolyase
MDAPRLLPPIVRPLPVRKLLNAARGLSRLWPCADADWTINPYRGCEVGCVYCHARYTHEFIERGDPRDFERRIYFKPDAAALLSRDLERLNRSVSESGRRPSIAIGSITDPYQPVEERLEVTRSILETLRKCEVAGGLVLRITTKSDLILRDLDLLSALARSCELTVNITITTLDELLARALEPKGSSPWRRLAALGRLREAGIPAGVLLMPLIPGVNDSQAAILALAREAKARGALYLAEAPLFLPQSAWAPFFRFLRREFPQLERAYHEAFDVGVRPPDHYRAKVRRRAARARRAHGLLPWPRWPRQAPLAAKGRVSGAAPRGANGHLRTPRPPRGPTVRQLEIPGM